jgi:hypothetical protein
MVPSKRIGPGITRVGLALDDSADLAEWVIVPKKEFPRKTGFDTLSHEAFPKCSGHCRAYLILT